MTDKKKQLSPLTGLRFFLAMWVVIFHQPFFHGHSWMEAFPTPLPSLFNTGYLAVGVFFTLSGFVLAYNYPLDKSWSLGYFKRYAIARFSRIYPAYFLGLVLSAPWVISALAKHLTPIGALSAIGKCGSAVALLQAWFPAAAETWNAPGWSLSVEAFFYCCLPVVGIALWRISRSRTLVASSLLVWASSLIVPMIAVGVPFLDAHGIPAALWSRDSAGLAVNLTKFTPLFHLPEFCMGILTARAYLLLRGRNSGMLGRGYLLYLPAMFVEVAAIVACQAKLYLFLHDGLLLPIHSLMILGLALDGGLLARFLATRPLVFLGNASYSMYIFHAVLAEWMASVAKHLGSRNLEGMGVTLIYLVTVVACSSIVYSGVEEPVHKLLRRKLTGWLEAPRREQQDENLDGAKSLELGYVHASSSGVEISNTSAALGK